MFDLNFILNDIGLDLSWIASVLVGTVSKQIVFTVHQTSVTYYIFDRTPN